MKPEPGSFGFEIRSLQEFMAARALTSGRDSEVEARLQQIAKAPMFRNVALFSASRLLAKDHHYVMYSLTAYAAAWMMTLQMNLLVLPEQVQYLH